MQLDKEKQASPVSSNINNQNEIGLSVAKAVCITVALALAIIGLYFLSQFNYLFFHTAVEVFSIVIAFAIFVIGWNSRRIINNNYLVVVSIAFLFIGGLSLLHSLTYRGMNVFEGIDSNWATQLWIATRYLLSLSLVSALVFIRRKFNPWIVLGVFSVIFSLLVSSIFFWQLFPVAYVADQGLTTFKVVSEYVISGIFAVAILLLYRNRSEFSGNVKNYLIFALVALIAAELSFTLYVDVYGFFNLAGHLLNLVAFYLIYKAIIETGLSRPHDLLFFNIKKNEETLKKSEERFRGALDNMIEGCQIIGRDWRYIYINDAAERHNRRSRTELLGNRYMDMWPGIESTKVFKVINECMENRSFQSLENFFIYPDNKTGWFDLKINPIPEGVFILSIDITERKKAEAALKESEERYRLIVETANEGIWAASPDGKTTFVNQRMADMLGYRKEDILGHIGLEFMDSRQELQVLENRCLLENKKSIEFECKFIRKDGSTLWTLASTAPILDIDGKHTANIAMHTDITDRKKAEMALKKSEERFFKAFNESPIALIITRYSDGLYIDINETFLRLFEYQRNEVIGRTSSELNIFASAEGRADYLRHFEAGKIKDLEIDFKTKSGQLVNTIVSSEIINLNYQDHILTTLVDITERKKTEEALNASHQKESFLARLIELASVAVGVGYRDGSLGMVNHAFEELTGYTADELRKISWNQVLTPPEYDEFEKEKLTEIEITKKPITYEKEYIRKDGSRVPIMLVVHPFFDNQGKLQYYFSFISNITERRLAEKALRQSEVKFRTAANYTYDWEYWLRPDGSLVYISPSCYRLTGYTTDDFLQNPILLKDIIYPDDRSLFSSHFEIDDSEIKDEIDFRIVTRNKEIRWISHACQPVFDEEGKWIGRRISNRDITERKRAEEARDVVQKKLEENACLLEEYANQMEELAEQRAQKLQDAERLAAIGATAGMVGHDIRNPLQAITGDLYFAKKDLAKLSSSLEKQKIAENLSSIETSVAYINKIVQDLQDFARPIKPTIQETDVAALCTELMQLAKSPSVSTSCQVDESLKKLPVDALILRRILTNLVTNAIQAMPEGGSVTLEGYKEGNDAVITVTDTGSGIPDDVKPKLFTPLMTTKSKGQGFGLAVVKRMTEALGGSVSFESEVGKGTKFIIRLPLKE